MRSGADILVHDGLSGSWLMPAWDKCTYHNSEMHSLTTSPNKLVLGFIPNTVKQPFRLGNGVVQLFNRAYTHNFRSRDTLWSGSLKVS